MPKIDEIECLHCQILRLVGERAQKNGGVNIASILEDILNAGADVLAAIPDEEAREEGVTQAEAFMRERIAETLRLTAANGGIGPIAAIMADQPDQMVVRKGQPDPEDDVSLPFPKPTLN